MLRLADLLLGEWKRNPSRFLSGYRFGRVAIRPSIATSEVSQSRSQLEAYFDQNATGPGLWKWRHYFPIYEKHLAKFVDQSPAVAEIGVYSGGSLRMWRQYFGRGTRLCGIDIEPACRVYQDVDTTIFIGDQADPDFLQTVVQATPGGLDVILDDGGHAAHQQIQSLEALLPHLRPGGVYLCEDIFPESHSFNAYIDGLARNLHATSPGASHHDFPTTNFQAAIESVTMYPFVVVIEKRQAALDHLEAPKHGTEWQPFYPNQ